MYEMIQNYQFDYCCIFEEESMPRHQRMDYDVEIDSLL
jgi:hypothetical protein